MRVVDGTPQAIPLPPLSVDTAAIQADAVTAAKIAADAVTDPKVASAAEIAVSKLGDGAADEVVKTNADGVTVEWGKVADANVATAAAIAETKVAGDAVDDTVAVPSADTATTSLLARVNQVLHQLKNFSGEAHWYTAPAATLTALFAKFHASTGHTHAATGSDAPKIPVGSISATGSPGATNLLRGDGAWRAAGATPSTQSPGDSALAGASGDWADAVHKHAMSGFGSSSGISGTLIDAKGDLIVGTADDTPARLAVGANGKVLTAKSSATEGVSWEDPAAGGYATVQEEGSGLTARAILNFIGQYVTAADNGGATRTDVTVGSGMDLIADTTLGSDTASITFSSIPGAYKHLRILFQGRTDSSESGTSVLKAQFNTDTGSNYDYQLIDTQGTTTPTAVVGNAVAFIRVGLVPDSTTPASSAGIATIDIPNYAGTSWHKMLLGKTGIRHNTSSQALEDSSGNWRNTAAITEVKLFPSAGNFKQNSRATIYGIQ